MRPPPTPSREACDTASACARVGATIAAPMRSCAHAPTHGAQPALHHGRQNVLLVSHLPDWGRLEHRSKWDAVLPSFCCFCGCKTKAPLVPAAATASSTDLLHASTDLLHASTPPLQLSPWKPSRRPYAWDVCMQSSWMPITATKAVLRARLIARLVQWRAPPVARLLWRARACAHIPVRRRKRPNTLEGRGVYGEGG